MPLNVSPLSKPVCQYREHRATPAISVRRQGDSVCDTRLNNVTVKIISVIVESRASVTRSPSTEVMPSELNRYLCRFRNRRSVHHLYC